jgi:hypothetical protein
MLTHRTLDQLRALKLDGMTQASIQARKPCSGWARSRKTTSTSAEVWRPISPACRRSRSGVQSA